MVTQLKSLESLGNFIHILLLQAIFSRAQTNKNTHTHQNQKYYACCKKPF